MFKTTSALFIVMALANAVIEMIPQPPEPAHFTYGPR